MNIDGFVWNMVETNEGEFIRVVTQLVHQCQLHYIQIFPSTPPLHSQSSWSSLLCNKHINFLFLESSTWSLPCSSSSEPNGSWWHIHWARSLEIIKMSSSYISYQYRSQWWALCPLLPAWVSLLPQRGQWLAGWRWLPLVDSSTRTETYHLQTSGSWYRYELNAGLHIKEEKKKKYFECAWLLLEMIEWDSEVIPAPHLASSDKTTHQLGRKKHTLCLVLIEIRLGNTVAHFAHQVELIGGVIVETTVDRFYRLVIVSSSSGRRGNHTVPSTFLHCRPPAHQACRSLRGLGSSRRHLRSPPSCR